MPRAIRRQRRSLRFESIDEIEQDAERCASGAYETVGNWSYGQILRHLAITMNSSLDGFGFQAPWIVRVLAPAIKKRFLSGPMRSGFRLPRRARRLVPDEAVSAEQGLAELKAAVARCREIEATQPHPVLGPMKHKEWTLLHCRHAELHLSFVVPKAE